MSRSVLVALLCSLVGGCVLPGNGGGGGGDDVCVLTERAPVSEPAPLRDPNDLTCTSFGSGCDPACGPCPALERAPIPSWGACGSSCDGQGPAACASDPSCRTAKDATCTVGSGVCVTDFLGCFPVDTAADVSVKCFGADAWTCSRSHLCEAHHSQEPCALDALCARPFATCAPVGVDPGHCTGQVVCGSPPPVCPTGTTPGIANGCFTGACIVTSACP